MKTEFLGGFSKILTSNFIKICPVEAMLFHAERHMDRHDGANSCFSQFCECA